MKQLTVKQFKERARIDRARLLKIMATIYEHMGERTMSSIAQRLGVTEVEAQRIMGHLRERELVYSTHPIYGQENGWHLTDAGWKEAGVEKPMWIQWAEVAA